MRQPDENREELWAWLLQRNARMYGVAFAIDAVGDVYLTGRVPLHAVTADELDRLLGSVLTYADESFDTMLEIGFGSAIRREWAMAGQARRVAGQPARLRTPDTTVRCGHFTRSVTPVSLCDRRNTPTRLCWQTVTP